MKSHPKKCNEQTYFQQNLVTLCYIFFKNYKNLRGASSNIILGARIFSTVGIEVEHSVTNLEGPDQAKIRKSSKKIRKKNTVIQSNGSLSSVNRF